MPVCMTPEGYYVAQDGPCGGVVQQSTYPLMSSSIGGMDFGDSFGWDDFVGGGTPGGGSWGITFPSLGGIDVNIGGGGGGGGGALAPIEPQLPVPSAGTIQVQSAGACNTGYHLRKNARLPGKCVRNRKMNSLNPDALRRATRRLSGFFSHVKTAEKAVRHSLGSVVKSPARRGCNYCGKSGRSCKCG